jgi:hypothetical protein
VSQRRPRLLILAAVVLVAVGIAVAVVDPFATTRRSADAAEIDAGRTMQTVQRRALTAQQAVVGTLGYGGTWTVAVPATTSAETLGQAEQQAASAHADSLAAKASLLEDIQTLAAAEATLQAAQLKETSDCAGANAAESAGRGGVTGGTQASPVAASATGAGPCSTSMQAAEAAQEAASTAQHTATTDQTQLDEASETLARARRALEAARSTSPGYGSAATYTMLPAAGDVIRRGEALYSINGAPTFLLYGATPAWRSFATGMSSGRDVKQLNANLGSLGFSSAVGDSFTSSTEQGIESLQRSLGIPVTGSLPLGSVVFDPGAARVVAVAPVVGQSVAPGPIITLSSTRHEVSMQLGLSQQAQVKVGDLVTVTLPDNRTTPGVVASVSKVAAAPSDGRGANGNAPSGSPSISVGVRLLRPRDAGTLDQAPVNILITTARVANALVVPVNALVALADGRYALEQVMENGTHQLVPVRPGLFDDEQGLVEVSGTGLAAGQRVVVPAS